MPYVRLYYHIVWATRDRQPIIDAEVTAHCRGRAPCGMSRCWRHRFSRSGQCWITFISRSAIPPKHAVATASAASREHLSHAVNSEQPDRIEPFAWQTEYGALSFGPRALDDVIGYVNNQPRRHANGEILQGLERWTEPT